MQPLDALTLKHLAGGLSSLLVGAKIQKMQQPNPWEFLVSHWGTAARGKLYIRIHPDGPCCFLLDTVQEPLLVADTRTTPTGFCMLLRKYLVGARIMSLETLPGERVLNIEVETENELGAQLRVVLSLELMGKHSNLILYLADEQRILGAAHAVTEEMSRLRTVAPGLPYVPPPPVDKPLFEEHPAQTWEALLQSVPPDDWGEVLAQRCRGFGKKMLQTVLSQRFEGKTLPPTPKGAVAFIQGLVEGSALRPALEPGGKGFTLYAASAGWHEMATVPEMVQRYFIQALQQRRFEAVRQELRAVLRGAQRKCHNRAQPDQVLDEAAVHDLQKKGDLLTTHASCGTPTSPQATLILEDFETGTPVEIAINPALSLLENARRYYKEARKARARNEQLGRVAEALAAEEAHLAELLWMVEGADTLADLLHIRDDLVTLGLLKPTPPNASRKKQAPSPPETRGVLKRQTSEGLVLYVGKSSQANAAIVGKLSRPEDIWLHVYQMPGSHVLIKRDSGDISETSLWEAANLAAYFSAGRTGSHVPVIYTECRHVRKIPGSYPGHVTYRHEQTLHITPDTQLVERLLQEQ